MSEASESANATGGREMKDYERSFKVVSSSYGVVGGRYVHSKMSRAAFKAGRSLFRKADKDNKDGRDNKVVEFELQEITMGRSKTAKKAIFRMVRKENPNAKMMTLKGVSFEANTYTYDLERIGSNATTIDHRG
jgi:hypothetical protein